MIIADLKNGGTKEGINEPLCLLVGNFDGVHEGHSKLAEVAVEEGRRLGIKVAAWTFIEHPLKVLNNGVLILTDNREKNEIFAQKNIDYVIYEDFSKARNITPADFIKNVLIDKYDCRSIVCGFNFKFGKNGQGTPEFLKSEMERYGRRAVVVLPVYKMGKVVSSTEIRKYLEKGQLEEASQMLGRPYSIDLPVIHGKELGRTIGIPTVNQKFPDDKIKPKNGIYACKCYVDKKEYLGVANIGWRPTVNNDTGDIDCETHIIGYNGWLYGKNVKICFYKRLRDEKKFEGIEQLKRSIEKDIAETKRYFGE